MSSVPFVIDKKLQRKIASDRARARKIEKNRQPVKITFLSEGQGTMEAIKPQSVREIRTELRQYANINNDVEFRRYQRNNGLANAQQAYDFIQRQKFADTMANNAAYFLRRSRGRWVVTMNLQRRWAHTDITGNVSWSDWESHTIEFLHKGVRGEIDGIIEEEMTHLQRDYMEVELVNYSSELVSNLTTGNNLLMPLRSARIVRQDWLKHARSIADYAYDETDGMCVYHQLTKYWNENNSGRKVTQLLDKKPENKVSPEAILRLAKHLIKTVPENFQNPHMYKDLEMEDGLTPEMIREICKYKKISCYIFDENDHHFVSCVSKDSHYSPIILYAINSHAYLVNDPVAIKSVISVRTNSSSHCDKKKKIVLSEMPLVNIDITDIEDNAKNCLELASAKYIIAHCENLRDFVVQFHNYHSQTIKTVCSGSQVIQMEYLNNDQKSVILCCDQTPVGGSLEYKDIVACLAKKDIPYLNEGIGYVINKLLDSESESRICIGCGAREEKEFDSHNTKVYESSFNKPMVENILKSRFIQTYARVDLLALAPPEVMVPREIVVEVEKLDPFGVAHKVKETRNKMVMQKPFKADHVKCRRNIVIYNKYRWPVFGVFDKPEKFDGIVTCAWYFIRPTKKHMVHRGDGIYGEQITEYMLNKKIITPSQIIWQIVPSNTLPADHFKNDVDMLLASTKNCPALQKIIVNSMIGLWGRTKRLHSSKKFSVDENQAATWLSQKEDDTRTVYIQSHRLMNGLKLHEGSFITNIENEQWTYPLYKHVLEAELVELATLEEILREKGAFILARSTDSIRYSYDHEINMFNDYFWDDAKTIPKYRRENDRTTAREAMSSYYRTAPKEYDEIEVKYKSVIDDYNNLEESVKQLLATEEGCHIDGRAGCGKSFYIRAVMAELTKRGINFESMAPTNVAANLVHGMTVSKFSYKHTSNRKLLMKELRDKSYIFIDEISMVNSKYYKCFVMIKRLMPWIKFIISGDFAQLLAVKDDYHGDMFNSSPLHTLCDGNRLNLTKCRRADNRLFELCKHVSDGKTIDINQFPYKKMTMRNIAYKHHTRMRVNNACMNRFVVGKKVVFVPRNEDDEHSQDMNLCVGMPVICQLQKKSLGVFKTSQYTVKDILNSDVILSDGVEDIAFPLTDFSQHFYPAFCITVHASQGCTINEPYTIYDWNSQFMDDRAKYVALSRATDISHIQIASLKERQTVSNGE
jgi:DNA replication protein DnaC